MTVKNTGRIHELVEQIEDAIDQGGDFSHNIVSIFLRQIDKEFGTKKANAVIDELNLTELFGIRKVEAQ